MAEPAPLSAEPSSTEDREKAHLAPKSYADAVEEAPPTTDPKKKNGTNGTKGAVVNGRTNSTTPLNPNPKQKATVLKIVDTGAPGAKGDQNERPLFERQESKREYSAAVNTSSSLLTTQTNTSSRDWMIHRRPRRKTRTRIENPSQEEVTTRKIRL